MPTIGDSGHPVAGGRAQGSRQASALAEVLLLPAQMAKTPPCCMGCPTGADVRGWISVIAQRRRLGLTDSEALRRAWRMVTAVNPFPATLGRICPHPCESDCNRAGKDGAVAIRALERFIGDWGLEHHLALPTLEEGRQPESIGVIGAGPAGLSFAYQMARRGYPVTVYEKQEKPGGMLYYGIPKFRLSKDVLEAEVRRLLDLGIELRLTTAIAGKDALGELQERHAALFLGIGAACSLPLNIPGDEGAGLLTGTHYLSALNCGERVPLGQQVVVVGGGNTAIDAARCARRTGARVTIIYRRTSADMPAIRSEVEAAVAEGVDIEYLVAPARIRRSGGIVRALIAQPMRFADVDASGRRRCVPIPGSEFELPANSVIAAVSRVADWSNFESLDLHAPSGLSQGAQPLGNGLWVGGDAVASGIAGLAIAHGRQAAEAVHAHLRGLPSPAPAVHETVASAATVKADYYAAKERTSVPAQSVDARLAQPEAEVEQTLDSEAFFEELTRCFSCGLCFGCELCFAYCNVGGFARLAQVQPGAYFSLSLDRCEGCRKCIEICPCGFLSAIPRPPPGKRG